MKSRLNSWKLVVCLVPVVCFWSVGSQRLQAAGPADQFPAVSCAQFMAPKHNANGKMVGQDECLMQDIGLVDPDHKYHRVEMGVSGTLAGWIVKDGRARLTHFTSAPDLWLTQFGNSNPRFHGILRYEAAKGTSHTLLYPETGWNGKVYVLVPGSGGSFRAGSLKPWDQVYNPARPFTVNKYEKLMLEKGYAIVLTRRNADRFNAGDYNVTLDNGEVWPDQDDGASPELPLDQLRLVDNFLKDRFGRKPTRNYWYGHSAGGYTGLAINYMGDEFNREPDGKNLIDGFMDDDPGGGLFVPIVIKNGQDVMFRTQADKAKFVKTIMLSHLLYPLTYEEEPPSEMDIKEVPKFISPFNTSNKRTTARVMKEKGMDATYRDYEIKGVSHSGGEGLPNGKGGKNGEIEIINMPRLMDALLDLLDNWVEKGIAPPPTKSEAAGIGSKSDAIALPEAACPLGVYYPYPEGHGDFGGSMLTGFAPFDGQSLEPLDGRVLLVDMNGNGHRDKRETVTEAWRRMGLLKPTETFDKAKYIACVQDATAKLKREKFISEESAQLYMQEAQEKELPSK